MKKHYVLTFIISIIILLCLPAACTRRDTVNENDHEELMKRLEKELSHSDEYDSLKCERIDNLKRQLAQANTITDSIHLNNQLIHEYESYISDSSMHYISENQKLAKKNNDSYEITRLIIRRADILSHAGLFNAAAHLLADIDTTSLSNDLTEYYFDTMRGIMQYEYEYLDNNDNHMSQRIDSTRHECISRILAVSSPTSFTHVLNKATQHIDRKETRQAVEYLEANIDKYDKGTRSHAILASLLAQAYLLDGNMPMRERYLTLSAISDIKGCVKENTAIRELAEILYAKGDIDRANRCLKKSIADAYFYSARMRGAQAGRLIPVIDASYDATRREMSDKLKIYVGVISVLAIILALAALLILLQLRRLRKSHGKMAQATDELAKLYEEVRAANNDLEHLNNSLEESNKIKEEYVARFMNYCSVSISALEQYQNSLNVLAQSGDKAALVKRIKSNRVVDNALREFYEMFDHAFLNIFPTFVDDFNNLLLPEYRVSVHEAEKQLNTELRTFALIRLGITDSSKIAQFLRCSITTIYTYRSKTRKRAISPDTFEEDAAAIASI